MSSENWKSQASDLARQGLSWRKIAARIGKPKSTVSDYLRTCFNDDDYVIEKRGPKILLIDIETTPSLAYAWGRFKQYLSQDQIVQEGRILCFAAKYLGSTETFFSGFANDYQDDSLVVCKAWGLLNEADIVIAHNAKKFDIPYLNARFVELGLTPPSSYKVIDTLEIARRNFRFPSNKLDSLGEYLQVGRKVEHEGFSLWLGCMQKEIEALEKMREYNIGDIDLLENVYLKLRVWDNKHPNVGQYSEDNDFACRVCGSHNVAPTGSFAYTEVYKYLEFACADCGAVSRSPLNAMPTGKARSLLRPVR